MAYEAEQAIYNRLAAAPTFHPANADLFQNDWGLDPGDVVAVKAGENTYSMPIYDMTLDWKGTSKVQIQSSGNRKREPLSALKRRQYASGRIAHENENGIVQLYEKHEINNGLIKLEAGAIGVKLDNQGNPIIDAEGNFVFDNEHGAKIYSNLMLGVNNAILQNVIRAYDGRWISGSSIDLSGEGSILIEAINNRPGGQSAVDIQADKINLTGYVTATELDARLLNVDELFATTGYAGTLYAGGVSATGAISAATVSAFNVNASHLSIIESEQYVAVSPKPVSISGTVQTNLRVLGTGSATMLTVPDAVSGFGAAEPSGGQISIPYYTNGGGSSTPAGTINFNIADTAYYQSHVGISSTGSWLWDDTSETYGRTVTANNGETAQIDPMTLTVTGGLSNHTVSISVNGPGGHPVAGANVSTMSEYNGGYDLASGQVVLPRQITVQTNNIVTVKYPETASGSRGQSSTNLYLVCDSDYAYILDRNQTSGATVYARIPNPGAGGEITAITHMDSWDSANSRYVVSATASGNNVSAYTEDLYVDARDAINSVILDPDDTSITSVGSNDIRINKGSTTYNVGGGGKINVTVYVTLSNGKRYKRSMDIGVGATSYAQRTYTLRVMNNNTGAYTTLTKNRFYFYG